MTEFDPQGRRRMAPSCAACRAYGRPLDDAGRCPACAGFAHAAATPESPFVPLRVRVTEPLRTAGMPEPPRRRRVAQ